FSSQTILVGGYQMDVSYLKVGERALPPSIAKSLPAHSYALQLDLVNATGGIRKDCPYALTTVVLVFDVSESEAAAIKAHVGSDGAIMTRWQFLPLAMLPIEDVGRCYAIAKVLDYDLNVSSPLRTLVAADRQK